MDDQKLKIDDRKLKIDVDAVLRSRAKKYYKFIPKFMVRWLERTICQDRMNEFLAAHGHERNGEFCRSLIDDVKVEADFQGVENIPGDFDASRVLFVSNHPLGGLDGIILIDFVERLYGKNPAFVVNDLLDAVKPLSDVFIPINKHGAQSREAVAKVDLAFTSQRPMIMFPAGLVSRLHPDGIVRDLDWMKMFVTKARKSGRIIIPVHFCGENSPFFYKFARNRKRLGLKFNIEMIYLPREVFLAEGKKFTVVIGKPIDLQQFAPEMNDFAIAQEIKGMVYRLSPSR